MPIFYNNIIVKFIFWTLVNFENKLSGQNLSLECIFFSNDGKKILNVGTLCNVSSFSDLPLHVPGRSIWLIQQTESNIKQNFFDKENCKFTQLT